MNPTFSSELIRAGLAQIAYAYIGKHDKQIKLCDIGNNAWSRRGNFSHIACHFITMNEKNVN